MKYVPYEVKETSFKNAFGLCCVAMFDVLFHPGNLVYSVGAGYFAINWFYRVFGLLSRAVVKIELHHDGETVTLTYKTGIKKTVLIKNI